MNEWIAAAIAAGAGLIIGSIAGKATQRFLSGKRRPEVVRSVSAPMGSLVFSIFLIAGLMTALGFVNEEALDQIPRDLVDYLPSVLSAAIVLIAANVVAELARTAVSRLTSALPSRSPYDFARITRVVILAFGAILAAAQLGVDTTIINISVAAALFGVALAGALMVGLGSRGVSEEVAAGRAIRRFLTEGDSVSVDDVEGRIVRIQSVAIEVDTGQGALVLVPHTRVLGSLVGLERAENPD